MSPIDCIVNVKNHGHVILENDPGIIKYSFKKIIERQRN